MNLDQLIFAIPLAWSDETRGNDRDKKNGTDHPASGQCIVSSLLVQRHCGGDIVRCSVGGESYNQAIHYFNEIGGVMIDTTRAQFSPQKPYRKFKKNPDKKLYIFPGAAPDILSTWDRVDLLQDRCFEILAQRS